MQLRNLMHAYGICISKAPILERYKYEVLYIFILIDIIR